MKDDKMAKMVNNSKKKSPPQKRLKVVLPFIVVRALKRLAAHSSKNSMRIAKGLYEYLDYNHPDRRRFV